MAHEPKSVEDRAEWIADALQRLLKRPALIKEIEGGGREVTIRIDQDSVPTNAMTLAVIRILGCGDDYGHSKTARWERVWAKVYPIEGD
ncbi:hypothetical protein ACFYST_08085 [Kitasatospora sp. NPDC004614]|uniref:hypothetical protein n=1 Tax=unclassified Kitasatospora TaxID=2633591 RepID=UPI0036A958F1